MTMDVQHMTLVDFLRQDPKFWDMLVSSGMVSWLEGLDKRTAHWVLEAIKDLTQPDQYEMLTALYKKATHHDDADRPIEVSARPATATPKRDKLLEMLQKDPELWSALRGVRASLEHVSESVAAELHGLLDGKSSEEMYNGIYAYISEHGTRGHRQKAQSMAPPVKEHEAAADHHGPEADAQADKPSIMRPYTDDDLPQIRRPGDHGHEPDEAEPKHEVSTETGLSFVQRMRDGFAEWWDGLDRLYKILAVTAPVIVVLGLTLGVLFFLKVGPFAPSLPEAAQLPQEFPTVSGPTPTQFVIPQVIPVIPANPTAVPVASYQVYYGKTIERAATISGRSGPGLGYAEILPALQVDIDYPLVPYPADPNWTIVVMPRTGEAAFYPNYIFTNVGGNRSTGEPDVMALAGVQQLYNNLSVVTQPSIQVISTTGNQQNTMLQIFMAIFTVALLIFIPIEAISRGEFDDGIHSLLIVAGSVLLGYAILNSANVNVNFEYAQSLRQTYLIELPAPALTELANRSVQETSFYVSLVGLLWMAWVAISPIRAKDNSTPNGRLRWFGRVDLNPIFNVFLLQGILGVFGVTTVFSLALGVQQGEPVYSFEGLYQSFVLKQPITMTTFTLGSLLLSVLGFLAEDLRQKKLTMPVITAILIAAYLGLRLYFHFDQVWSLVFAIVAAVAAGAAFDVYRRQDSQDSWGNVLSQGWAGNMISAVSVVCLIIVGVGTI